MGCVVIARTVRTASFQDPKEESGTVRSTDKMKQGTAAKHNELIRAREDTDSRDVLKILEKHNGAKGSLIAVLEKIQSEYGYLPEEALRTVSDGMGLSLVDIYGVATFYRSFSLRPRGRHLISVCLGTACHVRSAPMVIEEFERQLGIRAGETTPDGEFTLETVNCLGACALGPIVVVDGEYFPNVNTATVGRLLKKSRARLDRIEAPGVEALSMATSGK
jgi:NADH:ubiquinone oxidoreductase subunit E